MPRDSLGSFTHRTFFFVPESVTCSKLNVHNSISCKRRIVSRAETHVTLFIHAVASLSHACLVLLCDNKEWVVIDIWAVVPHVLIRTGVYQSVNTLSNSSRSGRTPPAFDWNLQGEKVSLLRSNVSNRSRCELNLRQQEFSQDTCRREGSSTAAKGFVQIALRNKEIDI